MADTKKSIEDWERERGVMLQRVDDPSEELTATGFQQLIESEPWIGVNHTDREAFLRDNGYEVTRENMLNGGLSSTRGNDDQA